MKKTGFAEDVCFKMRALVVALLIVGTSSAGAQEASLEAQIRERSAAVEKQLIDWRRDIHQHPELGDQEQRTSRLVAAHLKRLGLDVQTGVGRTGVVGILKGAKPGPVVGLRADMDALPVTEPEGLPFASRARAAYHGDEVGVMHACGHDAHTAMLMATAQVLAGLKEQLPGTVMFIFQPAEEGSSIVMPGEGKSWGAKLMLEEGLFKNVKPDAVFAVHVMPGPSGEISWRTGATTASGDMLKISVHGRQGHGGMPWNTIDPIVTSGQVLAGLQTVVSRRANLALSPAIVTIGMIKGGSGPNIIPDRVDMSGTIRAYDQSVRDQVGRDVKLSAEHIAESAGAKAEVAVIPIYATTVNDTALAAKMEPIIRKAADGKVAVARLTGASEDFSYLAQAAPGLYLFLGITPEGQDPLKAAPNHSPNFFVDERALVVGTRTMALMTAAFLTGQVVDVSK
jgi:amidohydrolase